MQIGFGAPVAGAWATPGYLTAFARRAEDAGYASLWSFQRLLVPEGSGMEPVYRSVLDPMVALGYVAASTARIRLGVAAGQPAVRLPHGAGQAGHDGGRAVRRAARPGPGHRVDARGVRRDRRVDGPARRADRGIPGRAADLVGRRGELVRRRVLHDPGRAAGPPAGAAPRAAGAAGRHVAPGHGAGRADRGRLDHLQPRRPVQDLRGGRRDPGGGVGGGSRPGRAAHRVPGRSAGG